MQLTSTNRRIILFALAAAIASAIVLVAFAKPRLTQQPARLYSATAKTSTHLLPISVDTAGQTINAAEVYLSFDPKAVRIDSVSKEGSIFTFWITDEPKFSNALGVISFAGGLPTPGFRGTGTIGSIGYTLLKPGTVFLHFQPRSRVLLNDGKGTSFALIQEDLRLP